MTEEMTAEQVVTPATYGSAEMASSPDLNNVMTATRKVVTDVVLGVYGKLCPATAMNAARVAMPSVHHSVSTALQPTLPRVFSVSMDRVTLELLSVTVMHAMQEETASVVITA